MVSWSNSLEFFVFKSKKTAATPFGTAAVDFLSICSLLDGYNGVNHGLIPNQMSHDAICLATTNDEYFVVADDFVDILCIVLDML